MILYCTQYKWRNKFPSQAIKELQAFKKQTEKFIQQKGRNHLLFSGLWNKGGRPHVLTSEVRTTMFALLKYYLRKRLDSPVHPVMQPEKTRAVGEFLNLRDKWDYSVSQQ